MSKIGITTAAAVFALIAFRAPVQGEIAAPVPTDALAAERLRQECVARAKASRPKDHGSAADIAYLGERASAECPGGGSAALSLWAIRELASTGNNDALPVLEEHLSSAMWRYHRDQLLPFFRAIHAYSARGAAGIAAALRDADEQTVAWAIERIRLDPAPERVTLLVDLERELYAEYWRLAPRGRQSPELMSFCKRWAPAYTLCIRALRDLTGVDPRKDRPAIQLFLLIADY